MPAGVVTLETEAALALMLEPAVVVKLCTAWMFTVPPAASVVVLGVLVVAVVPEVTAAFGAIAILMAACAFPATVPAETLM